MCARVPITQLSFSIVLSFLGAGGRGDGAGRSVALDPILDKKNIYQSDEFFVENILDVLRFYVIM